MSPERLKEIQATHDFFASSKPFPNTLTMWESVARQAHADRAALLAEVDRLKALCGDAAEFVQYGEPEPDLANTLREAAK